MFRLRTLLFFVGRRGCFGEINNGPLFGWHPSPGLDMRFRVESIIANTSGLAILGITFLVACSTFPAKMEIESDLDGYVLWGYKYFGMIGVPFFWPCSSLIGMEKEIRPGAQVDIIELKWKQ